MNGINLSKDKTFIIAEAGVNHNGKLKNAYRLIDEALNSGVDAVKFQTFNAEKMISERAKMAEYQKKNIGKEKSQIDMIKELELSFEEFYSIKKYCDEKGILFLSTPFDYDSVDFLNDLVPLFKIGSGEITNIPFLKYIASKNKPVILSTGMSNLGEVEKAIESIKEINDVPITLLHCTTNYPCPYEEVNLKAMITLREAFKLPVGYSDHTLGVEVPVAAVALGAKVIEKHFTLGKNMPGPDHKASLEPNELKEMVNHIRNVEKALGLGIKKPNKSEYETMIVARKSLVASMNKRKGEIVEKEDIEIKRPGNGLSPEFLNIIIGKKLLKEIKKDDLFTWEHFMEV
jgi:N-acetylneuraminate synthase